MATINSKVSKVTVTMLLFLVSLLFTLHFSEAQIGVAYGWEGDNLPSKQQVVDIYRSNGIGRMRIYFPDHEILQAVQGSGIQLLLDVPNDQLQNFAQNPSLAVQWVQQNVVPYASAINYLVVGNEVVQDQKQYVGPALQNVLNALRSANSLADRIKVTTAIGMSEISVSFPPSDGEFKDFAFMDPVVNFLKQNGSPLMLNVYPYFTYRDNNNNAEIPLDYALFNPGTTVNTDPNNGLQYKNLYDAQVDSVYAALARHGAPNTPVISSETGWPSAGHGGHSNTRVISSGTGWPSAGHGGHSNTPVISSGTGWPSAGHGGHSASSTSNTGDSGASASNANTYYHNVASHARDGTPLRPGRAEVYLFAMFDENLKHGDGIEQHFGIFNPDGQPKYPGIDFGA